jgi:hypothetical protein
VGFVVENVALGQVFPPSTWVFPCQFHSTGAPLHGNMRKKLIIFIFITGLHNKPQGCGASVASAAGPFTIKKGGGIIYESAERLLMYGTGYFNTMCASAIHKLK